jgi:hypothetical protein
MIRGLVLLLSFSSFADTLELLLYLPLNNCE